MILYLDTETRARVPIYEGTDRYSRDAQCTVVTYALNDGAVQCWDVLDEMEMPADLESWLADDRVVIICHNAAFDRNIVARALKLTQIRPERWRCTQAQASAHGLPGSLEALGKVLGLSEDQQKIGDGKDLIQWFCVPRADNTFREPYDHPEKWARFKEYAIRDTEALREIHKRLPAHNYQGEHLDLWHLDQKINERGFGFDSDLAEKCKKLLKKAKDDSDIEIAAATFGAVQAATQRDKMLGYLNKVLGCNIENLKAAEIREYLEGDDISSDVRFLLEARLEAAKSSGSKYSRGLSMVGPDGRLRHTLKFSGAGRTGRWSGRGYQPQNMSRGSVKANVVDAEIEAIKAGQKLTRGINTVCADALRGAIVAAPGNELVVADFSNIEGRVMAFVADEQWKLAAYRAQDRKEGADTYKLLFAQFFGTPVERVTDLQRQCGKVVDLSMQFLGGVGALVTMAAAYHMDLEALVDVVLPNAKPEHLKKAEKMWRRAFITGEDYELEPRVYVACDVLKQVYRDTNAKIRQFGYDLDAAVKTAVKAPGRSFNVGRCGVWSTGSFLIIQLPSGRRLLYAAPQAHVETVADPESQKPIRREWISYLTARGKSWIRQKAWAGLFVENIVQAIAADLLRQALRWVHADTLTVPAIAKYLSTLPREARTAISLHVHDEIVLDVPKGSYPLERLIQCITQSASWAHGLPLAAAGWTNERYGKR